MTEPTISGLFSRQHGNPYETPLPVDLLEKKRYRQVIAEANKPKLRTRTRSRLADRLRRYSAHSGNT